MSELEERLIKEGYLKLGFVKNDTGQEPSERLPFLDATVKFSDMVKVLLHINGGKLITEKEIKKYINNPDNYEELLKKVK